MKKETLCTLICVISLITGIILFALGHISGFVFLGLSFSFIGKIKTSSRTISHFGRKSILFVAIFLILLFIIEVYLRNPYAHKEYLHLIILQSFLNEFTMFAFFFTGYLLGKLGQFLKLFDKIDLDLY